MKNKHKMPSSAKQRQLIAIACSQLGIDKTEKENLLATRFGCTSSTELSFAQAEEIIDSLAGQGFRLTPKKRPPLRRTRPLPNGNLRRSEKIFGLPSPAEMAKIKALSECVEWRCENGMEKWMQKRFHFSEILSADEALKVIEGLKGMIAHQEKKKKVAHA